MRTYVYIPGSYLNYFKIKNAYTKKLLKFEIKHSKEGFTEETGERAECISRTLHDRKIILEMKKMKTNFASQRFTTNGVG